MSKSVCNRSSRRPVIRVLEILPGDRAIVSTRGLRRIVLQPSGRTVEELMPAADAVDLVRLSNRQPPKSVQAVVVSYPSLDSKL